MPENTAVKTTQLNVKQLTSGSKANLTGKLLQSRMIKRNKKAIVIYVICWILTIAVGYWLIHGAITKHRQAFLKEGVLASASMSEKVTAPLLANDILTLNVAIGELERKIHPVFSAILDHDDKIIAHSDTDAVNQKMAVVQDKSALEGIDGVMIDRGTYQSQTPVVMFSKDLVFSDVKIGSIIFGLEAQTLDEPIASYRMKFKLILGISTLLLISALFITDIYAKKKAARDLEAFEKLNKVGPYMLKKKIAQGGMAELYLAEYAREDGFKRTVAMKKILPHLSQNQDFIDMFIREARLAAVLQHPNIVQIFDLIKVMNASFIAMEYIHGKNLAEILVQEKNGLPVNLAAFLIQKVSSGLYYSHEKKDDITNEPLNIVHRDISPQNILVSFKGEIKISDFGISKATSEPSFTQAGIIKGKLSYLSPEQALGKEIDHRADIYALGLIFHELLTGKRLYRFNNELEAIRAIPTMEIPQVNEERSDVSEDLNDIIMKCLEKDRDLRYQTAKELHDDIVAFRKRHQITVGETNVVEFMAERFGQTS